MVSSHKPPLGACPREIWAARIGRLNRPHMYAARVRVLVEDMSRYVEQGYVPPPEWAVEIAERVAWLTAYALRPEAAAMRVQRALEQRAHEAK